MKSFSDIVCVLALHIPKGRVATYGQLARAAGGGGQAARSVTGILVKCKSNKPIPYHRIVYADGRVWMNDACDAKRKKLYKQEGIELDKKGRIQHFADIVMDEDDWAKVLR